MNAIRNQEIRTLKVLWGKGGEERGVAREMTRNRKGTLWFLRIYCADRPRRFIRVVISPSLLHSLIASAPATAYWG
ncbi:hypothetical protein BDM02DRAFT_3116881 [Thelephora ganbajun]|uniref:Uncharacterized protein n=1 Tax=Thelephora ganbajun TaxID=370292 RepID=A0ACB6ZEE7_THEGA|nr:hypothetical protein BDM02DRAFT_3116881 [Thelephora ganbajun]